MLLEARSRQTYAPAGGKRSKPPSPCEKEARARAARGLRRGAPFHQLYQSTARARPTPTPFLAPCARRLRADTGNAGKSPRHRRCCPRYPKNDEGQSRGSGGGQRPAECTPPRGVALLRCAWRRRARKRLQRSPAPASRRLVMRPRPERFVADFPAYGSAATSRPICRRCGRTQARLPQRWSRRNPRFAEACVAHRTAGIHLLVRRRVSRGSEITWSAPWPCSNPGRDDDLTFPLRPGPLASPTMVNLANASWPLGEVDQRDFSLIDRAQLRSADFSHAGVLAFCKNALGSVRFDAPRPCARRAERRPNSPASHASTS